MTEYHKIQSVFKRDEATKHKNFLIGQYSTEAIEYLANNQWDFTEKVDGTNLRIIIKERLERRIDIEFGGKTDTAQIPATLVKALQGMFFPNIDLLQKKFFSKPEPVHEGNSVLSTVVLYGEGYGAKIQKGGGNYRQDQGFVLFDVNIDGWWLSRANIEDIANNLQLDTVPLIGKGTLADMVEMAKTGFKSKWGDFTAEGIVAKPAIELKDRAGNRVITKLKYKDFMR